MPHLAYRGRRHGWSPAHSLILAGYPYLVPVWAEPSIIDPPILLVYIVSSIAPIYASCCKALPRNTQGFNERLRLKVIWWRFLQVFPSTSYAIPIPHRVRRKRGKYKWKAGRLAMRADMHLHAIFAIFAICSSAPYTSTAQSIVNNTSYTRICSRPLVYGQFGRLPVAFSPTSGLLSSINRHSNCHCRGVNGKSSLINRIRGMGAIILALCNGRGRQRTTTD